MLEDYTDNQFGKEKKQLDIHGSHTIVMFKMQGKEKQMNAASCVFNAN